MGLHPGNMGGFLVSGIGNKMSIQLHSSQLQLTKKSGKQ